jgi:hypothetical protein
VRKPGAFVNYYYRDHLFPNPIFRSTYDKLIKRYPVNGVKQYLQILQLAATVNEDDVKTALELLASNNNTPSFAEVHGLVKASNKLQRQAIVKVHITPPSLGDYDLLLNIAV